MAGRTEKGASPLLFVDALAVSSVPPSEAGPSSSSNVHTRLEKASPEKPPDGAAEQDEEMATFLPMLQEYLKRPYLGIFTQRASMHFR